MSYPVRKATRKDDLRDVVLFLNKISDRRDVAFNKFGEDIGPIFINDMDDEDAFESIFED